MSLLNGKAAGARNVGKDKISAFRGELARPGFPLASGRTGIGPNACFVHHDVVSEAGWKDVVDTALSRFGAVDILVNNAAIFNPQSLQDTSYADFEQHLRINQMGPFLGMRAVAGPMSRAGGGNIINIGSGLGLSGTPATFAYSATKWALRGMTKCAARDLAPFRIRVNAVLPGLVSTPMLDVVAPEVVEAMTATLPIKRLAQSEEIARVVTFLASEASAYMTGAEITVDGGGSA